MKRRTLLFLDDVRNPHVLPHSKMVEALFTNDLTEEVEMGNVHWVLNYEEFVAYITEHGLPDILSLDHDLADSHYDPRMYQGTTEYNKLYDTFTEKTGYDCAKWLVNYCMDNNKKLPEITQCHSQNPAGRRNINTLLTNFRRR